jgi:hypothetical protein
MHSNFITPPDLVESILIIDATEEEIKSCALACQDSSVPYNVYFYHKDMKDVDWLSTVIDRVDYVLIQEDSLVPVLNYQKFGPNQVFKEPADYFNK